MKNNLSSHIGIFFIKQVAKLPFWCIYLLADIFYLIVYYIVGYRKEVVIQNLKNSFPEKVEKEIKTISKKFFRHFSDLTLESIKAHKMREKDFDKRVVVKNAEVVNQFFEQGKSVVVLTMHYGNWEWSNILSTYQKHQILAVYKPLHNLLFDQFMNNTRKKFGAETVKDSLTLRTVINKRKKNEPVFIGLVADQTPPAFHKFWMLFLNQEALFFQGPASISKRFNYPLFFQKMKKTKRGKYEISFELLYENPSEVSETEIMKTFVAKMEEIIRKEPEYYLWSHRRWKHTRPEGIPLIL
ncbi:MAG: lysophospholipid acyltransferase family protein [Draconibacterium sp.]|nr:lysophospholipid acyltransferase family protein [Draconibacterium sp.]